MVDEVLVEAVAAALDEAADINVDLDVVDEGGNAIDLIAEELDTGDLDETATAGLITYQARALYALAGVDDEVRNRLFGLDAGGTLQEANAEQFDTDLAATDVGMATYIARALDQIGQDELRALTMGTDEDGGDVKLVADALDDGVAAGTVGLITYLSRALDSQGNDELRVLGFATDEDGGDQAIIADALNDGVAAGTVGLVTYPARALDSIGQDTMRHAVWDRQAGATVLQDPAGDISGGVTSTLRDNDSFTLYLSASGAVDVTINASPNGGTDSFEISESPVSFGGSGDDTIRFTYDADWIELVGSNTTNVQAIIREII